MIEAGAKIVPEKEMAEAIKAGSESFKDLINFQKKIANEVGKSKKELVIAEHDKALV